MMNLFMLIQNWTLLKISFQCVRASNCFSFNYTYDEKFNHGDWETNVDRDSNFLIQVLSLNM